MKNIPPKNTTQTLIKARKQTIALLNIKAMLILALCFSMTTNAFSEPLPERINFQHLLENKDIVLGEVPAIFQDSQGFMWFGGANALIRYDGYTFKSIPITAKTKIGTELLPVKMVADIYEDEKNILWISTRNGVLRFDPKTEKLIQIPDTHSEIPLTTTDTLQTLALPSGELLIASKSGLLVLDRQNYNYHTILPNDNDPDSIHHSRVQALFIDSQETLWMGTEAGLEKVNWEKQIFTLFKPHAKQPNLVPANSVTDILEDKDGSLWLATYNGLINFSPSTQKYKRYAHNPNNKYSISGNDIWSINLDSTGALWIASDGGGVSVFERHKSYPEGRFTNHKHEAGRSTSISSNQVRTVFEDNTGDIWVGNYPDGINFFDRSSAAINSFKHDAANPNSLSHNSVLSVREDENGNFWLGTDGGGLNFYNRNTQEFKHYKNESSNANSISSNAVLTAFIDDQGYIWVGTWGGGMAQFDPVTERFNRIPFDEQRAIDQAISTSKTLNNAHVWSIKQDSAGTFWVTTHAGGLSQYNPATKNFTHYVNKGDDPSSISNGITWDTFEDSKGNFWVATSAGLDLMDRESGTFKHYKTDIKDPTTLSNPSVLAMFEDSQNRLWFGTDGGLSLLNKDFKTFTIYNKSHGLLNDTIRQIFEDDKGLLWLSTNNGVSVLNPETGKVRNYNRDSGQLMGGFHTDSGVITQKGEVVFGGIEGLRFFNPKKLVANAAIPPVALTDLKLFADSVTVNDASKLLSHAINHTQTLTLDYKKSMFTLEFAALNFRDSTKNQYAYMLEGFDSDWLNVGDQRSAKYTNLNAGTYTFKVKGSNNDGVWNESPTTITIKQLPPPWLTWWAYTLYVFGIVAVILWFIHHQRQKRKLIEEQNRLLEAKVAERTTELQQKNHDIQAMLQNMPQGLFTVQQGEKIHPEYAHYLEDIFETNDIANRNVSDLLFSHATLGGDALDANNNSIFAIIGEDEMNYEFNKSLLIQEYDIKINNRLKHLALDWNPIIIDGDVNKLMVSVRDVTQLKLAEGEAQAQKRELDIISQLLNVSSEKVLGFEESSTRFIHANQEAVEATADRNDDTLALLFRNMHTIKGNCRTYGFTYLSDVVHEVESTYSSLKADINSSWDSDKLLDDLERVRKALAEYSDIYRTVLGRGESNKGDRHDGFWMSNAVMSKIEEYANNNDGILLKNYMSRVQSNNMEDVLVDIVSSLSSIASQLNKLTPSIKYNTQNIRIRNTASELLTDVFAHILRNCVDHGLESTDERVAAGKDERGTILINAMPIDGKLHIFINDDGKGIDLSGLFNKGVDLGRWNKESKPSNQEIADLVFCSGVSTKDAVTDISGRGVGMDAVKQFLTGQGGDVQLILQSTTESKIGYVPFELLVILPNELFIEIDADIAEHLEVITGSKK